MESSDSGGVAAFLELRLLGEAPPFVFFLEDITAVAVLANVAELESSSLRDFYLRSEVKCRVERALVHARFLAPHDSARRGPAADWCMLRATVVVELGFQLCTRPTALVSCTRHMSQKKENE